MTNTKSFASVEFHALRTAWGNSSPDDEPVILEFEEEILALCEKFGQSGQSGGSAPFVAAAIADAVKKLCLQKSISPILGNEWSLSVGAIDLPAIYQNTRCSALFKETEVGRPYYLDAIIWKEQDIDAAFTGTVEGITSRQYVKGFPFTPKTFYIDTFRERYDPQLHGEDAHVIECGDGPYVYFIKDKERQLARVWEYYDRYEKGK